jgi:hypothetical protein
VAEPVNHGEGELIVSRNRIAVAALTGGAAVALVLGGAAISNASSGTSSSSLPSSSTSGGSTDTAVTGSQLAKVKAAVKAKDSSITVSSVRKDPDGSYDVFGTKAGAQVTYDVSADLKTFTQNTHQMGANGGPAPAA